MSIQWMDAVPMIIRCHRRQHPEDHELNALPILEPQTPEIVAARYGASESPPLDRLNREGYVFTYCTRCGIDHGSPDRVLPL
jgi:hypothetical protein